GETLGVVGESGCGKSVTALSVLRLVANPPGRIVGGAIHFDGRNLLDLSEAEMESIRGNDISMIFQEPMTSLNPLLTIGRQMGELQQKTGTAIVLITHDMGVVAENADRIVVMYAGRKVEEASADDLFDMPLHPYTKGLLGSVPNLEVAAHLRKQRARLSEIKGIVPSLADLPQGCTFAPRCRFATEECRAAYPPLEERRPGHWVACWHADRLSGAAA